MVVPQHCAITSSDDRPQSFRDLRTIRCSDGIAVSLLSRLRGTLEAAAGPADAGTRGADMARDRRSGRDRLRAGLAPRARITGIATEPEADPLPRRRGRPHPQRPPFAAGRADCPPCRPVHDGRDERVRHPSGAAAASPRHRLPRPAGNRDLARARPEERGRARCRHSRLRRAGTGCRTQAQGVGFRCRAVGTPSKELRRR